MRSTILTAAYLLVTCPVCGQWERFEMGRRVIALEEAWLSERNVEAKRRALPKVVQAVSAFFALQARAVVTNLDEATRLLQGIGEPSAARVWADALGVRPTRFLVTDDEELTFVVEPVYPPQMPIPEALSVAVTLTPHWTSERQESRYEKKVDLSGELPTRFTLPTPDMKAGDWDVRVRCMRENEVLKTFSYSVSRIRDFAREVSSLRASVRKLPDGSPRQTVELVLARIEWLRSGVVPENRVRTAELLDRARRTIETTLGDQPWQQLQEPGDHWISLVSSEGSTIARLQTPEGPAPADGFPLVIALHGAGGSEHLFFEGYGGGRIRRLCRDRGWLLLAPRSGFFSHDLSTTIEELGKYVAIDEKRIFVVGHSMGGARALTEVGRSQGLFRGAAVVSGFGRGAAPQALKRTAFFVAAGERDFGLPGARRVREMLEGIGHPNVVYKEYAACEHLLVMGESLVDVFRFFDSLVEIAEDR